MTPSYDSLRLIRSRGTRAAPFIGSSSSSVSALAFGIILGCSSSSTNDRCVANIAYAGAAAAGGSAAGGSSATGGFSACNVGTGGSEYICPDLASRYSACTATHVMSDVRNVNMLLVVDKSSSMSDPHPSGNGLSKWDTMRAALGAMLTSVEGPNSASGAYVSLGLEFYPDVSIDSDSVGSSIGCQVPAGADAIDVPIRPGVAQLSNVLDVIDANSPGGYTPTAEALRRANDYFTQGDGRCLAGSKSVLLVTNGGANCNASLSCDASDCTAAGQSNCSDLSNCCNNAGTFCDDRDAVVAAIDGLGQFGVNTYVVGMPSYESQTDSLNAFANAGGVPNQNGTSGEAYYPISDAYGIPQLESDWSDRETGEIRTCDIQLKATPANPGATHVFSNCVPVYPSVPDGGSGWYIDFGSTPAHLVFTGDTCTALMSSPTPIVALDIFTDCPGE